MGIFSSINIAATGMSAERLRTDVISDNIANASTTSSQEGGYFRRSRVVLAGFPLFLPIWIEESARVSA